MCPFRITHKARDDLIAIARFTEARWGRDQRRFYLKRLDETFHALAENPGRGRECDEIREGYYKYLEGSHVIFYCLGADSRVEVVRVLHKRMDAGSHL